MAFSPALIAYKLFGNQVSFSGSKAANPVSSATMRPPGQLLWLHAPRFRDRAVVSELLSLIADEKPDIWILLTTEGETFADISNQFMFQTIRADRPSEATNFLNRWRPDISIWLTDHLLPAFIHETADRKIPLVLLDSGAAYQTTKSIWFLRRITRLTLRKFSAVLSGDEASSLALISAGAQQSNVKTTGTLELTVTTPPCNDAEWINLAAMLATRPVWLAATIKFSALESILAAHSQATRRAHRLLLIVVPFDNSETELFQELLTKKGFLFATRSNGEEPETGTQVYLADTEEELGLWYRLAPVSFLSQSNIEIGPETPDPLEAAALGSVVLHGPDPCAHEISYQRLARAGASRVVTHMGELAHALEAVLAPDRAAVMAHAGWQITSSGAEAMDAARQTIGQYLGTQAEAEE